MAGSIREVAREANVSLSTVSKVLNGKSDAKFASATRERVVNAAQRVGYYPNAIAQGLAGKRMNTLGLVMAYDQHSVTSDSYLGPCLDGILKVTKERRQKTVLFTEDSWEEALSHLPSYCDGHCDGLLLIIPRTTSEIVPTLALEGRLPFVLVGDSRDKAESLISVDVDNVAAARQVVAHLAGLGHQRIAAFCGNADFSSARQRLEGYRQGLAEAHLPYREDYVFSGAYSSAQGYENTQSMFARFERAPHERPTAIFCFSDEIARGALCALHTLGVSVPETISVVGFDDAPGAATSLTTVRQDVFRVGEQAAQVLLDHIDGQIEPGHRTLLPTELIVRETTAPPPPLLHGDSPSQQRRLEDTACL